MPRTHRTTQAPATSASSNPPVSILAGLHLPMPEQTALELARLAATLPGSDNTDRARLATVAQCLQADPPDLAGALYAAVAGVRHAFRPEYTEERPESYLLAACTELLACALYEPSAPPEGLAGASLPPVASHGHQLHPANLNG